MTQCSECLEALSTASLADIRPGTAIALHTATCYGCAAALEELTFAERRLEEALARVQDVRSPRDLAIAALAGSERRRRKRLARLWRGGLALAALMVVWAFMLFRRTVPDGEPVPNTMVSSITLTCLTPSQASELATPYLRSDGSGVFRSDELKTVTIRGNVDEFVAARNAIARFEELATCPLRPGEAAATATPADNQPRTGGGSTPDDR